MSGSMGSALNLMRENHMSSRDPVRPILYFIDDDLLRGPQLRNDYEFPYLH